MFSFERTIYPEGGQVAGQDEERVSKLSGADKYHVVITVHTIDQCTDAFGRSLSTIVELFNDIAAKGAVGYGHQRIQEGGSCLHKRAHLQIA